MDFTMDFSATCLRADAMLDGTFLQPTQTGTTTTTREGIAHPMTTQIDNDETDSQEAGANIPLHIQRDMVSELTQALVERFRYATKPDVIPVELTLEEYKGKIKA